MKAFLTILTLFGFLQFSEAQIKSFGVIAGGGVTIIDVEKVVEPYPLSDWNTFSLVFKGFGEYQVGEGNRIGLEAGANRLYYWEYPAPGYSWYNWRTEWTVNSVVYFSKDLGSRFNLQAGLGIHIFHSGTVLGLMTACSYSMNLGEKLKMPVFLRIEPIFGTATPVAVNIGTGLKYNLF